jgi:SAM-dependent methyltransferase
LPLHTIMERHFLSLLTFQSSANKLLFRYLCTMTDFISYISLALDQGHLFKLTLAKPRNKQSELKNIFFRPIKINDEIVYNATYRSKTNDQAKNYHSDTLINEISENLENQFFNADLYFSDQKISLLQSKKGHSKVLIKKENHEINIENHNHKKQRLISESSPYLGDLGLSSTNGKIYAHAQDKYKQINKYIELIASLIKEDSSVKKIVDMGCGKGYLTFALYDYLNKNLSIQAEVIGVEIRQDLVDKCNAIAQKNNLKGLNFELGSIDDYEIKSSDMVIALHACDIATDMAIAKGLEAGAKYIVVAPCCHKQIRKAINKTESVLRPILKHGILLERQAEMITDAIRALILESQGYEVKIFEFISSEHTGKNVMISAVKTGNMKQNAIEQIEAMKSEFGISKHYLESLI